MESKKKRKCQKNRAPSFPAGGMRQLQTATITGSLKVNEMIKRRERRDKEVSSKMMGQVEIVQMVNFYRQ